MVSKAKRAGLEGWRQVAIYAGLHMAGAAGAGFAPGVDDDLLARAEDYVEAARAGDAATAYAIFTRQGPGWTFSDPDLVTQWTMLWTAVTTVDKRRAAVSRAQIQAARDAAEVEDTAKADLAHELKPVFNEPVDAQFDRLGDIDDIPVTYAPPDPTGFWPQDPEN